MKKSTGVSVKSKHVIGKLCHNHPLVTKILKYLLYLILAIAFVTEALDSPKTIVRYHQGIYPENCHAFCIGSREWRGEGGGDPDINHEVISMELVPFI